MLQHGPQIPYRAIGAQPSGLVAECSPVASEIDCERGVPGLDQPVHEREVLAWNL